MGHEPPYNPLDKENLGESVAEALLSKPVVALPPATFKGAGIYALYYVGKFDPYKKLAALNRDGKFSCPIYVGKAVPPGSRKGGALGDYDGPALSSRLRKHAASIDQATNLKLEDFFCRYLVVEDIWIPLGESLLIEKFRPLWNQKVEGFGINDPGSGRDKQKKSAWDILHPGRPYADKLKGLETPLDNVMENTQAFIDEYVKNLGQ